MSTVTPWLTPVCSLYRMSSLAVLNALTIDLPTDAADGRPPWAVGAGTSPAPGLLAGAGPDPVRGSPGSSATTRPVTATTATATAARCRHRGARGQAGPARGAGAFAHRAQHRVRARSPGFQRRQ